MEDGEDLHKVHGERDGANLGRAHDQDALVDRRLEEHADFARLHRQRQPVASWMPRATYRDRLLCVRRRRDGAKEFDLRPGLEELVLP